jgi:hypothetical protein
MQYISWKMLFILMSSVPFIGAAQEPMSITLNKEKFEHGDTIQLQSEVPGWEGAVKLGVLHVWIEDFEHKNLWKFRYPVINGKANAYLTIHDSFPPGNYAFYFQLHNQPFYINGKLKKNYKGDSLRFTMLLSNNEIINGKIEVVNEQKFYLGNLVFEKHATFFLSPLKEKNINSIDATLITKLDSSFTPLADTMVRVTIGTITGKTALEESYVFDERIFLGEAGGTLDNVEVIGKKKSLAESFNNEIPTGFFRGNDGYIFDGLETPFFGISIFDYLYSRVPGVQFVRGNFPGGYSITWRGLEPTFFLNELQVSADNIAIVPPSDIAMVKVFRPPFAGAPLGGQGGAIAIYTKQGKYGSVAPIFLNRFLVNGYTPLIYELNTITNE